MAIPKIIHQTFPDKGRRHPDLEENIKKLKAQNPGWDHRFYDDADVRSFIQKNYSSNVLRYFDQINPHYGPAQADFFRYLLMYKYGGVYLDIKSTVTKPLDAIVKPADVYLLSHWRNKPGERYSGWGLNAECSVIPNGEFQQWHIVAAPRHPFLKAAILNVMWNIDHYDPKTVGVGKIGVLRVTGPIAYTLAIWPILQTFHHRMVDSLGEGFQYSIFEKPNASSANDKLAHEKLFHNHYNKMDVLEPIVLT